MEFTLERNKRKLVAVVETKILPPIIPYDSSYLLAFDKSATAIIAINEIAITLYIATAIFLDSCRILGFA